MSEQTTGLSVQEYARVQAALPEGEQPVLVVKPSTAVHKGWAALLCLAGAVMLGMLVRGGLGLQEYCWVLVLCGLPIWAAAGCLCVAPLCHKWRMARTLYVLTERRAMVLEPVTPRRERVVSFPLRPNVILQVQKRAGGYGDIIFAWELRWCLGLRVCSPVHPVGFMAVPQVERVAQMLADGVAAVPAEAVLPPVEGVQPLPMKRGRARFAPPLQELFVWAGMAVCGFSCLLQLTAAHYLPREMAFGRLAETTYATVLSLRTEESFWNSPASEPVRVRTGKHAGRKVFISYYPTVQFADAAGQRHTIELSSPQNPRHFRPGAKVTVRYDRLNPQRVSPGRTKRGGTLACVLSCIFYLVGGSLIAAGLMHKTTGAGSSMC